MPDARLGIYILGERINDNFFFLTRRGNNGGSMDPSSQKIFELTGNSLVKLPLFCRQNEILVKITTILSQK